MKRKITVMSSKELLIDLYNSINFNGNYHEFLDIIKNNKTPFLAIFLKAIF